MKNLKISLIRIASIFFNTTGIHLFLIYFIGPIIAFICYKFLSLIGVVTTVGYNKQLILFYGWAIGIPFSLYYYYNSIKKYANVSIFLKLKKLSFKKTIFLVVFGFSLNAGRDYLNPFLSAIFSTSAQNINMITTSWKNINYSLFLLTAIILGPLVEEMLFRCIIFRKLTKNYSPLKIVVIQAILFGIVHLNIVQGSLAVISGIFYLLVVLWTGSLYAGIIAHVCNNFFAFMYFPIIDVLSKKYLWIGKFSNEIHMFVAILFLPMLWLVYKNRNHDALDLNNSYYK